VIYIITVVSSIVQASNLLHKKRQIGVSQIPVRTFPLR